MYFTSTVENLSNRGVIRISCVSTGEQPGEVVSVRIKRKLSDELVATVIKEIDVSVDTDFTFSYIDNECRSMENYDYYIIPVESGDIELVGQTSSVYSKFNGIYLSDQDGEWYCVLNPTYDYTINTAVSYVKPIKGSYSIRVSNGDTRYASGSVQGLFLPTDSNGAFNNIKEIVRLSRRYKNSLLDWLCNNQTKLLKTYDGNVWRIGIDANPK